jgi:purine-binding chemotaxis protein CheW
MPRFAAQMTEANMADSAQYLTLGLGQETFGIDIRGVREILDMQPITRLPHAPHFLIGIIDVRGVGYPVVDLRAKLGMPRVEPTSATRIIIIDVTLSGRTMGIGFVADRVLEVTRLDDTQADAPPDVGGRWVSRYISAIGRKDSGFVIIFDLERLMEDEDVSVVAESIEAAA